MTNKRFLFDFEIEAEGCLPLDENEIHTRHPNGEFEVTLSNLNVERGAERMLLSMQLLIPTNESIQDIKDMGIEKAKEFLYLLAFATNFSFKIHKLVRIIDWTIGLKERQCIQFQGFPGSELPYPRISKEIIESIEILQKAIIPPSLKRALKWFSNGVNAQYSDDQFQYFWLTIELIAQLHKKPEKVNDTCPQCRTNLYCPSCQTSPSHRPYPKQVILQLMEKFISNEPIKFFDLTNKIRNAIIHGDSIEDIEKSNNFELNTIVDNLGKFAWAAILNTILKYIDDEERTERLRLLQTNMYSHQTLTAQIDLTFHSRDPNSPKLSECAKPEISLNYPEEKQE